MGCSEWCREEFRLTNFGFGLNQHPELTVTSQWRCIPPIVYLGWRWLACIYHMAWMIVSIAAATIYTVGRETWLIYLTNWTYLLLTTDVLIEAIGALLWYIKARKTNGITPDTTTWYMKLSWFMYSVSTSVVLLVGITYWAILYSPRSPEFYIDLQTHGITIVYVMLNLAITGMPVRIYHVLYPFLFALVYVIFTVIYYYAGGINKDGGRYIYRNTLDWADPSTSLTWISILTFVGIPVIQLLVYGLYLLRVVVNNKCTANNATDSRPNDQSEMSALSMHTGGYSGQKTV